MNTFARRVHVLGLSAVLLVTSALAAASLAIAQPMAHADHVAAGGKVKVVIAGTNATYRRHRWKPRGHGHLQGHWRDHGPREALGYRTVKGDPSSAAGALITLRFVTKGGKGTITYVIKIDTKAGTSRWTIASGTKAYKGLHGKGTESENADFHRQHPEGDRVALTEPVERDSQPIELVRPGVFDGGDAGMRWRQSRARYRA